jgi:glycosyltransferase involved in cell wall biosynthesis
VRLSVLIPTYNRPDDLARCLDALAKQQRPADEVILVVRDSDRATWERLRVLDAAGLRLRTVTVTLPGVVQALNAGLSQTQADIVAITDDDAAPHPDWTERLARYFEARADVGGVGGRDRMHIGGVLLAGKARVVGKVPRVGKHVGNHHLGYGSAREVDALKGVNCAYRVAAIKAIGFDTRLRGSGAQVHWEISLGLALKRAGWSLVYDPEIVVEHFLAERYDEDQRFSFNPLAMQNAAYNETLIRMDSPSAFDRIAFLCWAVVIGTRANPGLAQWIRFVPREGSLAGRKLKTTLSGRLQAWRDAHGPRPSSAY